MQRLNDRRRLKAAFRNREHLYGAWTSLAQAHTSITEIFARSGVDFVGIDIEHSTISQEQSRRTIAASQAGGSPCFNWHVLKDSLKLSYPLTPRIFLGVIGNQFDKYMIGLLGSIGGVGIYSIGQSV